MLHFTPPEAFLPFAEAAQQEPSLRHQTFRWLRDFIYQLSGIYIPEHRYYFLKARLLRRLEALGVCPFEEYCDLIGSSSPLAVKERQELLNSVILTDTQFFRSPEQFVALARYVLPELAGKRRHLRLWSAGCAIGEEAYSLAMVVASQRETVLSAHSVEVLATDLSSEAIAKAQAGRYLHLHGLPEEYRGFVSTCHEGYEVVPAVRSLVRFSVQNLLDSVSVRSMAPVDVLFCRNVLLYFAPEVRRRVAAMLVEVLRPGGYLFLGAAETLSELVEGQLQLVRFSGTLAYRKLQDDYVPAR
ncbi:MAG: protein-glutamate O-methyltransferase CheR [Candidatus Kapabacteria bacterium]|nr:protein-glutamate O-methyltransferase CheR [Candidatus Kapabacteria bacterium]